MTNQKWKKNFKKNWKDITECNWQIMKVIGTIIIIIINRKMIDRKWKLTVIGEREWNILVGIARVRLMDTYKSGN